MHPTDYKEWSDNKLVEEYLVNQQIVFFDELYKRYSNKVYYKCYSLLGDFTSAEDATQDIFLKIIVNLSKFNFKSKLSTWLYSITYNHCIDQMRRFKKDRIMFSEDPDISDPIDDSDESFNNEVNLVALQATLDVIDEADRAILIMKYQDNLMVKDIANILNLSESAVKMRLKRAKEKFQKIFFIVLKQ